MTDNNKKILEEFDLKFQDEANYMNETFHEFRDFLIEKLQEERESVEKKEKANIEQHMVYLFEKLTNWLPQPRFMSKRRKDAIWSLMCKWTNEYLESLKTEEEHR